MHKLPRSLIAIAAVLIIPILAFMAWQLRRDHVVRAFCRNVHVGTPVADLIRLERQHSIDSSYLVLFTDVDFEHQAKMPELIFRSHMFDPEFECVITQNGVIVTEAALVPE
jgi:hypothetical protein